MCSAAAYAALSKKMKFQSMFLLNPDNRNLCSKNSTVECSRNIDRFTTDNGTRAGVCFHAPSYQIRDSIKYFIKQQNRSCITTWNSYQYFVSTNLSSASLCSF